ncbi:MAG: hypothetical protein A3D35_03560 [Candidatus Staskawiczbacteria bacterium RIFCSPHIGHO2_02_FULL_34_9]|uniref:YgjP-like metallopeptidase domain-containing protein n=1 Tax=Candidatus Staskawiczbacteria bacterium RIFCSPHIGHO2_02_FULL_34_9 TaxID=1802206 RepID=A0A1G2HZE7_9BACT|nr:MAG: hypothetical protein A3D35_03560 [Candidatus Staskawiczbacteria bacterium RIFCSPHIGHO2_02_FULL_34_9]
MVLQNKNIDYTLRKSNRTKRVSLSVSHDGSVAVTIPYSLTENVAERFLQEKANWLFSRLEFFKQFEERIIIKKTIKDYAENKEKALSLVKSKVVYFSKLYEFEYNRISVRNQKTRWGSCSKKRNINFNYKILFLTERLADYIIVHELCHTKELNHSKNFWNLVKEILPDYKKLRKEIKQISLGLNR